MTEEINTNCWLLVIDTDSYSGNFERELTAYLVGQVGDCCVGTEMATIFKEDIKTNKPPVDFDNTVFSVHDEHGVARPCTIFPTPGWYNDGKGGHYRVGDEARALKTYKKTEEAEIDQQKVHFEGYLKDVPAGWTEADVRDKISRLEKQLARVKKLKKLKRVAKYPAYQSVAIFFLDKPSKETITWLKERAKGYPAARKKSCSWEQGPAPKIIGWRLIKNTVTRVQKGKRI